MNPPILPQNPEILYLHMAALGDAIMASPALRLLSERIPGARITVLARRAAAPYFRTLSSVQDVIPFVDERHVDRKRPWKMVGAGKDLWRVLRALRSRRWCAVLQWRSQLPDTLLAALSPADHKILGIQRIHRPARFGAEQLQFLYHDTVELPAGNSHLVEAFEAPARRLAERFHLGGGPRRRPMEYPITSQQEDEAAAFLRAHSVGPHDPIALLGISTRTSYNQWSDSRFAGLADAIQAHGYRIILSGVPEHREREQAIARSMMRPPLCATGVLSLGGTAALTRRCRFVVALNTGIVHVAAALGVPVAVLNGRDGIDISPWGVDFEMITENEHYPRRHPNAAVWPHLVQRITLEQAREGVEKLMHRISAREERLAS